MEMEFTSEFEVEVKRNSPDDNDGSFGIIKFPTLVVMLVMLMAIVYVMIRVTSVWFTTKNMYKKMAKKLSHLISPLILFSKKK